MFFRLWIGWQELLADFYSHLYMKNLFAKLVCCHSVTFPPWFPASPQLYPFKQSHWATATSEKGPEISLPGASHQTYLSTKLKQDTISFTSLCSPGSVHLKMQFSLEMNLQSTSMPQRHTWSAACCCLSTSSSVNVCNEPDRRTEPSHTQQHCGNAR